jgi:hypothetical protein
MQATKRKQRLDPFKPRLANADQYAAGERHLQPPGPFDHLEPHPRILVR